MLKQLKHQAVHWQCDLHMHIIDCHLDPDMLTIIQAPSQSSLPAHASVIHRCIGKAKASRDGHLTSAPCIKVFKKGSAAAASKNVGTTTMTDELFLDAGGCILI